MDEGARVSLLAAIVDSSDEAILSKNLDGVVTSWNHGAETLYGYKAEEIVGQSLSLLIGDDRPEELTSILEKIRRDEHIERLETTRVKKGGAVVQVALTASPIHDGEGHVVGAAVIARDLTGRSAEPPFGDFLEAAPDAMVVVDERGTIVLANSLTLKLFGYAREELPGMPIEALVPARFQGKHPAQRRGFVAQAASRSMAHTRDLFGLRKDGSEFLAEISLSPLTTPGGRYTLSAIRDITERRRAEDRANELSLAVARLTASEQRYRTLTESANDAICVLTPGGVLREVNRRFCELLGVTADQCVGRHIRDFAAPGRAQEQTERFEKHVAEGSGRTPPAELLRADGTIVLVEFSNTAVAVGDEQLVLVIGRDVTEQVRSQAMLMVSDRMASVGTLAAGVAHEINNPLAAVLVNLEVVLADLGGLSAEVGASPRMTEVRDALADAREGAERVRQIVKDLKIFSRAEEDRRSAVDTRRVLESTLRMAWNEIRHRARLVKSYGEVPPVDANEARLGQVFLNLVVNAAQAIPEGRADDNEIRITTSMGPSGRVVVEIRDTGPGMSPDTLGRLFTPFFTTKPPGVGTGLGLVICQRIVASFGGELTVESQVGVGTAFRVHLPASRRGEEERVAASLPPPAPRRGHVLVVDDDLMVGRALLRVLSSEHEVEILASAEEALARLAAGERFDVILCDMMMPVVSGVEFYERLLETSRDQAERIVFVTGGTFTAKAREFLDRVPNVRLEKPFEPKNLRALVNSRVG